MAIFSVHTNKNNSVALGLKNDKKLRCDLVAK